MNTEEFIRKSNFIHNSKYNYNLVIYTNAKTKVPIICSRHGVFNVQPSEHLRGVGCKKCFIESLRLTKEQFIIRANKIHNNKYDYSKSDYKTMRTNIVIKCPIHGYFNQKPIYHLKGSGCKKCAYDINDIITKAQKVHGDKYDYSELKFESDIKIICKLHGPFIQRKRDHLKGAGCPICAKELCLLSKKQFKDKANLIHNSYYDYEFVDYKGAFTNIVIVCPKHGKFEQMPSNHLSGAGCKQCAVEKRRLTTSEFISKAITAHGNRYDYSETKYIRSIDKIKIKCKKHGVFEQKAINHSNGQGCPKCQTVISTGHQRLIDIIPKDIKIIINDRSTIRPYEIDIFIPEFKFGIEYHGNFWHSFNKYIYEFNKHKLIKKHQAAIENDIMLLQFYEYELEKLEIIKSMIIHKLYKSHKIYARSCSIGEVSNHESE